MLTALVFACGFVALAVAAFVRHPIFGLYLYLAVFYVHPPSRWWNAWLPDLRWSLLAAAVTILALMLHRIRHRRQDAGARGSWLATVPTLALMLYVAWMWFQSIWALDPKLHVDATVQFTKYVVAFYLIWRLANTPARVTDVLLVHVAGCFYLGWVAFGVGLTGGPRLNGVGGPGIDDANSLAMFLGTGAVVGAVLLLQLEGWRRWFCIAAMPFILNGVILAGSRGAVLGLLTGGLVLAFLRPPESRRMFWLYACLGLVLAATLVDTRFVERMLTVKEAVQEDAEIDESAESRVLLTEAQWRMFQSYPLGSGHKGTAVLSGEYLDEKWLTRRRDDEQLARSSHNTFLTTLVEQGIVGAAFYVWLSLWGLVTVLRLKRMQRRGVALLQRGPAIACCAAIAVVWMAGQFTDYLMAEVQIWMFALLASSLRTIEVALLAPKRAADALATTVANR